MTRVADSGQTRCLTDSQHAGTRWHSTLPPKQQQQVGKKARFLWVI
jgi:hypothetical protein